MAALTGEVTAGMAAELAARLIRQVGVGAVREFLDDDQGAQLPEIHPITAPAPGLLVLACACGQGLDLADMHRRPTGHSAVIDPVTCRSCATARRLV